MQLSLLMWVFSENNYDGVRPRNTIVYLSVQYERQKKKFKDTIETYSIICDTKMLLPLKNIMFKDRNQTYL